MMVVFPRMSDVMADEDDAFMAAAAISVATAAISAVIVMRRRKKRKRTMWVRPMFRMRQQYGAYDLLLAELRSSDKVKYKGFVRFTPSEFDDLLVIIREDIARSTRGRLQIPADVRLAITLFVGKKPKLLLADWLKQLKL